ncbi:nucleoside phosphorylase [Krasilnikovia sp. M28-CT-15]|uniref:nucleoside phosphorylase n=1 Tax=Krasilnikovia sp. M28-CT-15 TaxID=3373540 RepID=UPI00399CBA3C
MLEFDGPEFAYLEPAEILARVDLPRCAVLCFFSEVLTALSEAPEARLIAELHFAHGRHPIYELRTDEGTVAVVHPGVGGPLAGAILEELIALGCDTFVACGGAGALSRQLSLGDLVVVESALRDEGTSFHYQAAGRTVDADARAVLALVEAIERQGDRCSVGRTWTTDALYRETPSRVARRVAEDCLTVEMEAAGLLAVAAFRGMPMGYLLYAGDSLAGDHWAERAWSLQYDIRERAFRLATSASLALGAATRPAATADPNIDRIRADHEISRGAIVEFAVVVGVRTLTVAMQDVDPAVATLVPLRLDCYLRPNLDRMVAGLESALGVTLPNELAVHFAGSRKLERSPSAWHRYLPDGDLSGVRTVERVLVQLAAAATGADAGGSDGVDPAKLHAVTCPLVTERIDLTFICALELF